MRTILTAIIIALLAVPALAQFRSVGEPKKPETKQPDRKAEDKSYKSAVERLPDQKYDPWRNIR